MKFSMKRSLQAAALSALVLTAGCATPPTDPDARAAYDEANDPLEPMNRYFFEVNYAMDQLFFRPIAGMYRTGVPEPVRDAIRNMLRNLRSPLIFIHDLAQGEPHRAGVTLQRFALNSTIGLGGLIDVADELLGLQYHDEDAGQTLAVWGAGESFYLMLPFYGPSNPRDAGGIVIDSFIDPLSILFRIYGRSYRPEDRSGVTRALSAPFRRCPSPVRVRRQHCNKPNRRNDRYLSTTHTTFVGGFFARERGDQVLSPANGQQATESAEKQTGQPFCFTGCSDPNRRTCPRLRQRRR